MVNKVLFVMVATLLFSYTIAFAVPCGDGGVTGSTTCQNGVDNNDSESTVNTESFFGFTDWDYLAKQNIGGSFESSADYDWAVTTDNGSDKDNTGDWSFNSSVWSSFEYVMIVVKSGKHKTDNGDIFFSSYLLNSSLKPVAGNWDTGGKDLSHLTLYGRGEGSEPPQNPVPEPTTMLLFGTGLVGLVGIARRRKKY